MKKPLAAYLFLLFLSLPTIFWRLGAAPVYRSMEGRECLVVQEIVRSHEWILPLRNGEDVPHKPLFMHWIGAMVGKLRGGLVDEWTARFPSALASLLSLLLLFELVRRESNQERGVIAALILLTCESFTRQAREAWVDATLSACVLGAMLLFRQAERRGSWKGGAYYGFFALIALAVLSKGPVGALIPLMTASAFLLSTGRKSEIPRLFSPFGIAIVSAIALPWYAAAWAKGGNLFFTTQLVRENLLHFFRGQEGARPFFFFVPGFLVEAGPWSLLFPFAAWQAWKKRRQPTLETLCFWWWLTSFVFFSLAAGKRRVYLLPTMPAVAVLVTAWLDSERHWRAWKPRTRVGAALATFLLLFSICGWMLGSLVDWWPGMGLLARLGEEVWRTTLGPLSDALAHHPYLMAASALGVALSGAMVAHAAGSGQQRRLLISVLGFLCFFTALPKVMKWESYKRERAVKNFALASGGIVGEQPLHYFRTGEISQAFFYLGRHVPRATCEFDPQGLAACPPGYYFIDTRVWEQLPAKQRRRATVVLRSAGMDGAVRREDLLLLRIDDKRAPS